MNRRTSSGVLALWSLFWFGSSLNRTPHPQLLQLLGETRHVCHPIRSSASSELPKTSSRMIPSVASFKYSSNTFSI